MCNCTCSAWGYDYSLHACECTGDWWCTNCLWRVIMLVTSKSVSALSMWMSCCCASKFPCMYYNVCACKYCTQNSHVVAYRHAWLWKILERSYKTHACHTHVCFKWAVQQLHICIIIFTYIPVKPHIKQVDSLLSKKARHP